MAAGERISVEARLIDNMSKAFRAMGKDLNKVLAGVDQKTKKTTRSMGVFSKVSREMVSGLGMMLTRFGPAALLVGGLTSAFLDARNAIEFVKDTSAEFEATLSNVKAVIKPAADDFDALTSKARELGAATVFTASQSGEAFVEMGKLGFDVNQILSSTEDVLNIAAAANKSLAESSEVVVKTLNQYELEASDAKDVTDLMAKSFTSSALDFDKFRESMRYVGTTAHQLDLDLTQTTSMLGILADRGVEASTAGTSLNQAFSQLANPSSKINKIFAKVGKQGAGVIEKMRLLAAADIDVGTAFEFLDIRAARALNVLLKNIDGVDDLTASFRVLNDDAKKMADTMIDNVTGASKILEAAQQDLAIEIGNAFNTNRLEIIRDQTKLTQNLTEKVRMNASAYAALADAGGAVAKMWARIKHEAIVTIGQWTKGLTEAAKFYPELIAGTDKSTKATEDNTKAQKEQIDVFEQAAAAAREKNIEAAKVAAKDKATIEAAKKNAQEMAAAMKAAFASVKDDKPDDGGRGGSEEDLVQRKIDAAKRLQEDLHLMTLTGYERDLEELRLFEEQKRQILEDGKQGTETLEMAVVAERQKIKDKAVAAYIKSVQKENMEVARGIREQIKIEREKEKAIRAARRDTILMSLDAFSSLTEAMGVSAKKQKRIAQTEAAIQGFLAVQKALAAGVPPWNIIQAGLVGVKTTANVMKIQQQNFGDGGMIMRPTMALMGEAGTPEAVLNPQATMNLGVGGVNALNSGQPPSKQVTNDIHYSPTITIEGGASESLLDILRKDKEEFAKFWQETKERGYLDA